MRIVLHAARGDGAIEAFARGCQAAGWSVAWLRPQHWVDADFDSRADAVMVHGLHHGGGRAHHAYRAADVPVWIFDLPRLRHELPGIGVYLNDLQWLPPHVVRRVSDTGVIRDRTPANVLVIGQKPDDHAHGMNAPALDRWIRETITGARCAGIPVVFRPHPYDPRPRPDDRWGADALSDSRSPIGTAFGKAAVVVTYNSTAGWEAIAAGVPVVALDPHAAYAQYTTTVVDPAPLTEYARAEALGRAASSQWTMHELADPSVIEHLFMYHTPVHA